MRGVGDQGEEVQASVARCLRTPPEGLIPQDFGFGLYCRLGSEGHRRSMVVVGNYALWTDNGGTSPGQSKHLYTFVDPISAPSVPQQGMFGGAAGYRPRVRTAYSVRVYAHSPVARTP